MTNPRYRSILRSMLSAVLQSDMSAKDLRALASELRRGRFADELAYLIDRMSEHFMEATHKEIDERELAEVEALVKKNKISRSALLNILHSIDENFEPASERASIIAMLRSFFNETSDSASRKLVDILQATGDTDPFLKGITDRRR